MTDQKSTAGRPTKPANDIRSVTFRLRLTEEERERLDSRAEAAGQTPSQYARERIFKD